MADVLYSEFYDAMAAPSARNLVRAILRGFRPATVVEVGSVTDVYLTRFLEAGVEAYGTRGIGAAVNTPLEADGRVLLANPEAPNPFGFTFDLALCLEVADKLPADQAVPFVKELCAYADQVVFSAAVPGQGGFHLNPQPLDYWVQRFWEAGFVIDLPLTLWLRHQWLEAGAPEWLPHNVAAFVRGSVLEDTVDRHIHAAARVDGVATSLELRLLHDEASRVPAGEASVALGARAGRIVAAMGLGVIAGNQDHSGTGRSRVFAVDHHVGGLMHASRLQPSDVEARTWDTFVANLRALRLTDSVIPVLADAVEAAMTWQGPRVRLLVLDAARNARDITVDFSAWQPHLAPGALVVFGGIHDGDGPRQAMETAVRQGTLEHSMVLGELGFARVPDTPVETKTQPGTGFGVHRRRDRISLIMPTRNEGTRLKATVDSLLENTFYPDFELIVMDDASSDGSTDFLLNPSYHRDERITLVRGRQQRGYVARWMEGVERTNGSILKFLDAHHCFEPYWLTSLYDALARRDFRALVGSVVGALDVDTWTLNDGPGLFGYTFENTLETIRVVTYRECGADGRVPWLTGHQMMMTRATYEAVGGFFPFFEGHGTEDSDLCLRAFLMGVDCYVEPASVIGHYYRSGHLNPVTHADICLNVLMSTYLNLGESYLETWYQGREDDLGFREGRERMEARRAELECFRDWIVRRQSRTPEELLEHLAHY